MGPATITGGGGAVETTSTILGKYKLGRLLGQGAFAKVYHAHSLITGADVAIKVTDKMNTNVALAPLILREVTVMRRLKNHPNILGIHELLATKTKIYLVMDLADGGDLHAVLGRLPGHRLKLRATLGIFHQLVSALHFCHHHGVSHRDLKPHNLLLDLQGNLKLSDFGLSAVAGEGSSAGIGLLLRSACGTPVFMAPEVMGRRRYSGPKADAWSCGVILYMMLAGALPFDPNDVITVMYKKMMGRGFEFPTHFAESVKALIYRLLDPNPNTRLSIEEIVRDSWFKKSQFGATNFSLEELVDLNEKRFERGSSVANAFDLIGLDLSGLVDDDVVGRERKWFVVKEVVGAVVERVMEVAGKLRYEVKSGKCGKIWLKRGRSLVMVEVLEVVAELSVVEVVVVEGCLCVYCGGDDSVGGGVICGGIEEVLHRYLS